tara:strand:+ start:1679 stop:1918 length:240 start_codon:yes stop_codon:yes gene_type:complete
MKKSKEDMRHYKSKSLNREDVQRKVLDKFDTLLRDAEVKSYFDCLKDLGYNATESLKVCADKFMTGIENIRRLIYKEYK